MKPFHYINLALILIFLIAICYIEEAKVSTSLTHVQNSALELEEMVSERDSLLSSEIVMKVENLEARWVRDEGGLCFLVNHKSISELGIEITKLKGYVATDDIDAFKVSLVQIQLFCKEYLHFMGASLHNVL